LFFDHYNGTCFETSWINEEKTKTPNKKLFVDKYENETNPIK